MRASLFLAAGAALLASSCSTAPGPQGRSASAQRELDEALAGRVAGAPLRCIPSYRADQMQIIDDWTILYRDGRTVYVQTPRGGCPGIANRSNTLVVNFRGGSELCDGQINELVDLSSGIHGGACVFGPFVPYTRPR